LVVILVLSDRYFRLFSLHNRWACRVWASPYQFCPNNETLKIDSRAKQRFTFSFVVFTMNIIFANLRMICQAFRLEEKNETYFYYLVATSLAGNICIQILSLSCWKFEGIAEVFNQSIILFKQLQGTLIIYLKLKIKTNSKFHFRKIHNNIRFQHVI